MMRLPPGWRTALHFISCGIVMALLLACATMPVGTMWKLRNYEVKDLAKLDPNVIRAAVKLDMPVGLDMEATKLAFKLERKDGTVVPGMFQLVVQPHAAPEYAQLPKPRDGQRWYVMLLSSQGVQDFHAFQSSIGQSADQFQKMSFSVSTVFKYPPHGEVEHFRMQVELLLKPQDGFFTLIKETKL